MLQLALLLAAPAVASDALAVRAEHLFLGRGEPIENGVLVVTDGKVTAVGSSAVIPEGAVVVPGTRPVTAEAGREWGLALATPVIVKYRDDKTDTGTELEQWLR